MAHSQALQIASGPLWMVDDEVELVQSTVAMLSRELGSGRVRGSTDSREVSAWIEKERPAALITDIRMPFVNGLELVTQLHEKWGSVPVVVITAFPTAQVDAQAGAGRFAYLPKPFTFRSLRETLARICQQPASSAFSGAIAVSMLDEVVQLYGLANRTGTLQILSNDGIGQIGFESGRVTDSRLGALRGVDAFNEILSWKSGSFSWNATPPVETTIQLGLSELLLDAYRVRDEMASVQVPSPDPETDDLAAALDMALNGTPVPVPRMARNNVKENLTKLESVDGFLGAAVFNTDDGVCVAAVNHGDQLHIERAVATQAELVRAKQKTIAALKLEDSLEDIIVSLRAQYHLVRLCRRLPSHVLYLVLDRSQANLAIARHALSDVERDIVL